MVNAIELTDTLAEINLLTLAEINNLAVKEI
jgi:hypothetical protein